MQLDSWSAIEHLIKRKIPEGPSLEYKSALPLSNPKQRVETLKDLTGMGNGGGGSLVYGVEEDPNHEGVPVGLSPLTTSGIVGVLEDVARSASRPPLLMDIRRFDGPGGFLLAIEVLRSPLGPYMVEAYDERRYFIRVGTRTAPMDEQQVRDAYALAVRGRERREQIWIDHYLPMEPASDDLPWLTVSAVPEEPLSEVLDSRAFANLEEFRRPDTMRVLSDVGAFDTTTGSVNLRRWADGIYGQEGGGPNRPPYSVLRLHRDGSAALGRAFVGDNLPLFVVLRALNAQAAYLAWLWQKVNLRTPIEIEARVENLGRATVQFGTWPEDPRLVEEPPGINVPAIHLRTEFTPQDLIRASVRHTFVRDFGHRLHQAFGYAMAGSLFGSGWLYGESGRPINLVVSGSSIWDSEGRQMALLYDSGRINDRTNQTTLGYVVDGVIMDEDGRAMVCVEMATGVGLPDAFLQSALTTDTRYQVPGGNPGEPLRESEAVTIPAPVAEWSSRSLEELVQV